MNTVFDSDGYISTQTKILQSAISGNKSLSIMGNFLHDEMFTTLIEDYPDYTEITIMKALCHNSNISIEYYIDARDVVWDKQFEKEYIPFEKYILKHLALITSALQIKPNVIFVLLDDDFIPPHVHELITILQESKYKTRLNQSHVSQGELLRVSYGRNYRERIEDNNIFRGALPMNQFDPQHAINLIAQALGYTTHGININTLSDYIPDVQESRFINNCKLYLQQLLDIKTKNQQSGHDNEDDIALIQKLLNQI